MLQTHMRKCRILDHLHLGLTASNGRNPNFRVVQLQCKINLENFDVINRVITHHGSSFFLDAVQNLIHKNLQSIIKYADKSNISTPQ